MNRLGLVGERIQWVRRCGMKESPRQDPEPTARAHPCNAPNLTAKQFLLAGMHDPQLPIRERMRAASALLRIYPRDWDAPAFTYRIGGIPDCSLSTSSDPGATDERLGNNS